MSKPKVPLKTHGGKTYLADKIIELMPPHRTYAEVFGGGLAVLLAKDPEGISEIVNDLNERLMNFWAVMRSYAASKMLVAMLEATPFSESVFYAHRDTSMRLQSFAGDLKDAFDFFVQARQSMSGKGMTFAPVSVDRTRRGMNEQVSAWLSSIMGLPEVHERMKRVLMMNRDFEDFIKKVDHGKTLFYCDPPYVHSTRKDPDAYGMYEMDDAAHERLLVCLSKIKGKFILSGYDNDLYRKYAKKNRWFTRGIVVPNNSAKSKKKRLMREVLWMNYDPSKIKGGGK